MLRHPNGTPFTYSELGEFLPTPQGELFGLPGYMPEQTASGLVDLSDSLGVRKIVYRFDEPLVGAHYLPKPVVEAVGLVSRWVPTNTAILKRYELGEPSQAYFPHEDPEIFQDHWLVLMSIRGKSRLTMHSSVTGIESVPCGDRDVICIAPHIVHSVTPPLNEDGVRDVLFLGYDNTRPRLGLLE